MESRKRIKPYDRRVCYYGEFKTWIQYVGDEDRPALCIARKHSGVGALRGVWVIAENMSYMYVDVDGYHSKYMEHACPKIVKHIGLTGDRHTCFRIAEAILKGVEDMLAFPPPIFTNKVDTEVDMTIDGKTFTTQIASDFSLKSPD